MTRDGMAAFATVPQNTRKFYCWRQRSCEQRANERKRALPTTYVSPFPTPRPRRRQSTPSPPRARSHALHHEKELLLGLEAREERDDERVVHLGEDVALGAHVAELRLALEVLLRDGLHRVDLPVEPVAHLRGVRVTILTLYACALVAAQEPAPVAKGTGAAKMR